MTPTRQRLIARAAGRICAELRPRPTEVDELPQTVWDRCERLLRLLALARSRGWTAAERVCRNSLRRSMVDLHRQLEALAAEFGDRTARSAQTLREIHDDLVAVEMEFTELNFNLREATISVITTPVVLEGVDLGRFEICLDWRRLGCSRSPYTVSAVDKRRAVRDSALSHPHVRDDRLCEGDGEAAIRSALRDGRLLDFFTIVAQTLSTYNPQSAYLALDDWLGASCTDCGAVVDSDETSCCERCEQELCGDCQCRCTECGRIACTDCGTACSHCGQHYCRECLNPCADCGNLCCERSLDEERCEDCRAAAEAADQAEDQDGDPPAIPPAPNSPDHTLRLGEASVPP